MTKSYIVIDEADVDGKPWCTIYISNSEAMKYLRENHFAECYFRKGDHYNQVDLPETILLMLKLAVPEYM